MKILFLCIMVVALFLSQGCSGEYNMKVAVNGNQEIRMKEGETLLIEMSANPTTGYNWEMVSIEPGKDIVRPAGEGQYERESDLIGAGGIRSYPFKAVGPGECKITFDYKRSWEKEPIKSNVVTVIVK